jgi:hypothetical protein
MCVRGNYFILVLYWINSQQIKKKSLNSSMHNNIKTQEAIKTKNYQYKIVNMKSWIEKLIRVK